MQLIFEALIVGILTVIIGTGVFFILESAVKKDTPSTSKDPNEKYIKGISLFLTGVIIHLTCELVGANKWYCKNGYACSKKD